MAQYQCDNPEIEAAIKKLESLVKAVGSYIDDQLIVHVKEGEISLHSSASPEDSDVLVSLPEAACPFFDEADIILKNDAFQLFETLEDWPAEKVEILEVMLEILNLASKAATHQATSPWMLAVTHRQVFERLLEGRPGLKELAHYRAFMNDKRADRLAIGAFFMTRGLVYEDHLALMPFIDFVNHHQGAQPFQFTSRIEPSHVVALMNSKPVPGSDECFVQYSNMDAYDLFLSYGYVDQNPPYVRSVPLNLDLAPLGAINVRARPGVLVDQELPANLEALKIFLPKIISQNNGVLDITHLAIPLATAPHALQRVLAMLVKTLNAETPQEALKAHVYVAEKEVLETNLAFYRDLIGFFEGAGVENASIAMATNMAKTQLAILEGYRLGDG